MSDIVKWGLLAAGLAVLVGLVVVLPVSGYMDMGELTFAITQLVNICGSSFRSARGIVNCFLSDFGRNCLTGIIIWLLAKWAITIGVKIVAWTYHFIFRG